MSWKSGGDLFESMFELVEKFVPNDKQVEAFLIILREFRNKDFDGMGEFTGFNENFDKAYKTFRPDWDEDEDED